MKCYRYTVEKGASKDGLSTVNDYVCDVYFLSSNNIVATAIMMITNDTSNLNSGKIKNFS
jgi:hypothetical protein